MDVGVAFRWRLVARCSPARAGRVGAGAGRPDRQRWRSSTRTGVHAFAVELATNDAERARGLMFRKELPEGHGMLFDFKHDQPVAFWMHNTYISLDMIFIARRRTHRAHCGEHRAAVGHV